MPTVHQFSLGLERQVSTNLTAQIQYQMLRGRNQIRSVNINQPVQTVVGVGESGAELLAWVRPDPTVGNITQYESIGRSDSDRLTFTANYRVPRKAIFFGGNYTIGRAMNDFDGATSLPMDSLHLENRMGTVTAGHPASRTGAVQHASGVGNPRERERQRAVRRPVHNHDRSRHEQGRPGQRAAARHEA